MKLMFPAMVVGILGCLSALAADDKPHPGHAFLATGAETYIMGADGKVLWTYPRGSRDGWVLPDGNVLLAVNRDADFPGGGVVLVTPGGKETVIFKGTQAEVNTAQPLENGNVLFTE